MTEEVQGRRRKHLRLWLALAMLVAVLAVLFVPPLVSLRRYKSEITHMMAASLGRPVRLSSVELHLLPWPALVLTDLTVEDDPAYGAEPVLHANTVTASFRLLSLWRGRLEISRISVDEASLNLVRTEQGRWNLDTLFRTATAHGGGALAGSGLNGGLAGGQAGGGKRATPFPYLEATNSRINFKSGAEKLPLSLVNTDLSFWQEEPGKWRIRLRGQPARTDVSLDLADTGEVRLEASVQRAAELREMPVHLDLEWQEAQLGQLARLVIGSDPGWRGDLTGELHLDGTADAARIKTRLRATGVHRAEFAPAAPMDFDAMCGFDYHFSSRALQNLACDSPLGDGRIHLAGDLPGEGGLAHFSVALDRIPVAAGLDALRTVRSGFGPGLEAKGTMSGMIAYAQPVAEQEAGESSAQEKAASGAKQGRSHSAASHADKQPFAKARPATPGPLTGSLAIEGFQLSGDGLSTPIQAPKLTLEPVAAAGQGEPSGRFQSSTSAPALIGSVAIPAGGTNSLTVTCRLTLSGYRVAVRGQASFARARELAHVAGNADAAALDTLAGDPVVVDLRAEGPWLPAQSIPIGNLSPAGALSTLPSADNWPIVLLPATGEAAGDQAARPATDSLSGTVILHNANWKADYLANYVEIAKATLHLDNGEVRWDPVDFSYGPVKGTASLTLPANCDPAQPCLPRFDLHFGDLDASALQAAILGAHEPGTLLTELIARLSPAKPSSAPAWPQLEGTVKADTLILGPVTLRDASATLHVVPTGAEIGGLTGDLLGGSIHGSGTLLTGDKPVYTLETQFEKLNPTAVGQLIGLRWSGGVLNADGKIELSGFADKDLAASAKGTVHLEWRHGAVSGEGGGKSGASAATPETEAVPPAPIPPALVRFDHWTADAEIANGKITLKQNQVQQGSRKRAVEAVVTFGDPPVVRFTVASQIVAKKR